MNGGQEETSIQEAATNCFRCQEPIVDRFLLKVNDRPWHCDCLRCDECNVPLTDKCYVKDGVIYCRDDFFTRYGTRCSTCNLGIPPTEAVRRAHDQVFHLECFHCAICRRQLKTGDEFYLVDNQRLICKTDYEASQRDIDLDGGSKRPRTTITARQLEVLRRSYLDSMKPSRLVRERLSAETGLDMRVVQVWFQNRRAKEKRMKRDWSISPGPPNLVPSLQWADHHHHHQFQQTSSSHHHVHQDPDEEEEVSHLFVGKEERSEQDSAEFIFSCDSDSYDAQPYVDARLQQSPFTAWNQSTSDLQQQQHLAPPSESNWSPPVNVVHLPNCEGFTSVAQWGFARQIIASTYSPIYHARQSQ